MDKDYEVFHIRGRRITGVTRVKAAGYIDAQRKAKPALTAAGVNRSRVRLVTNYSKTTPFQKVRSAWRSWSGF